MKRPLLDRLLGQENRAPKGHTEITEVTSITTDMGNGYLVITLGTELVGFKSYVKRGRHCSREHSSDSFTLAWETHKMLAEATSRLVRGAQ